MARIRSAAIVAQEWQATVTFVAGAESESISTDVPRRRVYPASIMKRIVCLGGGPAGLYAAILFKKAQPKADVEVYERNRAGAV